MRCWKFNLLYERFLRLMRARNVTNIILWSERVILFSHALYCAENLMYIYARDFDQPSSSSYTRFRTINCARSRFIYFFRNSPCYYICIWSRVRYNFVLLREGRGNEFCYYEATFEMCGVYGFRVKLILVINFEIALYTFLYNTPIFYHYFFTYTYTITHCKLEKPCIYFQYNEFHSGLKCIYTDAYNFATLAARASTRISSLTNSSMHCCRFYFIIYIRYMRYVYIRYYGTYKKIYLLYTMNFR